MEKLSGDSLSKIRLGSSRIFNHPATRVLTAATLLIAGCRSSGEEKPLSVTYDFNTTVSDVFDKANPNQRSDEYLFANIPEYEIGKPQESIRVLQSDFFNVHCEANQMLILPNDKKVRLGEWSGEVPDGKDFTYVVPHTGEGPHVYTRSQAIKVNRQQLDDKIQEIVIKVGGRVVGQYDVYGQEGVGLGTSHEIVRAAEFRAGKYQATCEFRTKDGNTYKSTADIEILANQSY